MTRATVDDVLEQMLAVLREAFEGPPAVFSYFTDREPGAGLKNLVLALSAEEATADRGGTSIAAHVQHLVFALQATAAFVQGDPRRVDWKGSWSPAADDPASWERLAASVHGAHESMAHAIREHAADSPRSLGASLGALAHVAYHLGAIRRMRRQPPS